MFEGAKILIAVSWAIVLIALQNPSIKTSLLLEISVASLLIHIAIGAFIWSDEDKWNKREKRITYRIEIFNVFTFCLGAGSFFNFNLYPTTALTIAIAIIILYLAWRWILSKFPPNNKVEKTETCNDTFNLVETSLSQRIEDLQDVSLAIQSITAVVNDLTADLKHARTTSENGSKMAADAGKDAQA